MSAVEDAPLFDATALRVDAPQTTAGERLRARQGAAITVRQHPLSVVLGHLPLHPDAAVDPVTREGTGPRCGDCALRVLTGGGARNYPKCYGGTREWTVPMAQRRNPRDTGRRVEHPRATHGEATDVRSWWPACRDHQPATAPEAAR